MPSASVTSSDRHAAEQRRSREPRVLGVVGDVLDPDATDRAAVLVAHDELLRDVDETTGQVAGVGGTKRGVGETLAGTVGGDEVLEHREALTEVALDRPRDDLTTRVGHQTTHTGDLTHLHDVAASTRAHHHLDGVELLGLLLDEHGLGHLVGGVGPDLDFLLAPLVVGDDAAVVLLLDLLGFLLVLVEDRGLGDRRPHVGDGDRETGTGGVLEARAPSAGRGSPPPPTSCSGRRASPTMSVMSRFFTTRSWNVKSGGNASLKSSRPSVVSTITELSAVRARCAGRRCCRRRAGSSTHALLASSHCWRAG